MLHIDQTIHYRTAHIVGILSNNTCTPTVTGCHSATYKHSPIVSFTNLSGSLQCKHLRQNLNPCLSAWLVFIYGGKAV